MAKLLLTLSALVALAAFAAASVYPDHEPRDVWHARINSNIDKVTLFGFIIYNAHENF